MATSNLGVVIWRRNRSNLLPRRAPPKMVFMAVRGGARSGVPPLANQLGRPLLYSMSTSESVPVANDWEVGLLSTAISLNKLVTTLGVGVVDFGLSKFSK